MNAKQKSENTVEIMSRIPLFDGMTATEKDKFLSSAKYKIKTFKKGETIFREGAGTKYMGIVLSGAVLVEHSDVWGNNTVLGGAKTGGVFGEVYACLPNTPLLISVTATENSEIMLIDISDIIIGINITEGYKVSILANLLKICANKSLELSRKILHNGSKTIRGRLMSYFSECIQKSGAYKFDIPYNRQQLADYLGVDRSAMCSELSKMQKEGIISYHKNSFKIEDEK